MTKGYLPIVVVRFAEDLQTTAGVWVVPARETAEGEELPADAEALADEEEGQS